jgi:hypothetical protein
MKLSELVDKAINEGIPCVFSANDIELDVSLDSFDSEFRIFELTDKEAPFSTFYIPLSTVNGLQVIYNDENKGEISSITISGAKFVTSSDIEFVINNAIESFLKKSK